MRLKGRVGLEEKDFNMETIGRWCGRDWFAPFSIFSVFCMEGVVLVG